jgi:hypothetical protein
MIALALTALLSFTDPQGDAYGDGSLQTPTASVNRTVGSLDLTGFELYDTETLGVSLTFASLTNPFNFPMGFSFPIIEVYIDDPESGGSVTLLPGSDMRLSPGSSWDYAFKLSGDYVRVFEASNGIIEITDKSGVKLTTSGNTITLQSSLPRPENLLFYAVIGNYTPFNETGWMPTSPTSSPWAYWSESQTSPVVDVLASSIDQQRIAIQTGTLTSTKTQTKPVNPWFFAMFGGITLALLGVIGRFFVKATPNPEPQPWAQEEIPETPGTLMAAERTQGNDVIEDIKQEAEKLNQHVDFSHETINYEAPSSHTEFEAPTPQNKTKPPLIPKAENSDKLFDVWVDDDISNAINWEMPEQKTES